MSSLYDYVFQSYLVDCFGRYSLITDGFSLVDSQLPLQLIKYILFMFKIVIFTLTVIHVSFWNLMLGYYVDVEDE